MTGVIFERVIEESVDGITSLYTLPGQVASQLQLLSVPVLYVLSMLFIYHLAIVCMPMNWTVKECAHEFVDFSERFVATCDQVARFYHGLV